MKDDVNHTEHRGKGKFINLTYVMHLYKTSQVNPNLKRENKNHHFPLNRSVNYNIL